MRKQYDFSKAKRGPVIPVPKGKSRITIRLDDDVLTWFREQVHAAGGGSYQTLINDALRTYVTDRKRPLELFTSGRSRGVATSPRAALIAAG